MDQTFLRRKAIGKAVRVGLEGLAPSSNDNLAGDMEPYRYMVQAARGHEAAPDDEEVRLKLND